MHELTGTIVPLVTPFKADETFDQEGLNRLIAYIMDQGADGIMATALTGEEPLLSPEETKEVWDAVLTCVAGRLPVVPTIITTTTRAAVNLARYAESSGATALMAAPILPELYAARAHEDVIAFYADLAAATDLPIILFNYPSLTGMDFTPELVVRLCEIEHVRYIKESTGDSKRVHQIMRLAGDRISVICGAPNVALESLALGCRIWITGIMNVVPRSARQLMQAVYSQNDLTLARRIYYEQILPVVDILARNNNPTGTIKAGVTARGVEVGIPRRPGSSVSAADQASLTVLVKRIEQMEEETDLTLQSAEIL